MRHSRSIRAVTAAVAAATVGLASAVTALSASAADTVVITSDFEAGSADPWQARGSTIAVVDTDAHTGTRALSVTGRTADWQGVQTDVVGLVAPGQSVTVSGWVKLLGVGSTTAKFSVHETTADAYTQVSTPVTVDGAAWVEMSGTYTVPAGQAGLVLYVEAAEPTASFLVDDITVTASGEGSYPGGAVDPTTSQVTTARGTGNVAALTFDDGPNPGETEQLLDLLAAEDIDATFCVIGQNVQAPGGAEILQRIVAEGHTLCNHTTSYADMGTWTADQIEADLKANLAIIRDALGDPDYPVPYFRAPDGSWGATPQVAVDLGMQPLGLGNVIFDWDGNDLSVETLSANLRTAIVPGAVVLAHDGGGDRSGTIAAVEAVVPEYVADGWTFTLPAERGPGTGGQPVTVTAVDFDDETLGDWTASGSPSLAYVDADGGKALAITRAADYEGIQSPTGLLQKDVVYTFSMRAMLPDDAPVDATRARFVVKPNYDWVGDAEITKGEWTQITGTYTVPAAVTDLNAVQIYLGTADQSGAYTLLVDDITVTRPAGTGDHTPVDLTFDFEDATLQGWEPRDAGGSPTVTVTDAEAHESVHAALVSDRDGQGDGIRLDVSEILESSVTYDVTAWVKMAAGEEPDDLWLSMQRTNEGADAFDTLGQFADVGSTGWTQVQTSFTMADAETAYLYFETAYNGGGPGAFLVDDITIRSRDVQVEPLTPLMDTVDFPLGVAIDGRDAVGSSGELTLRHFNQVTAENHMKVEAWYDETRTFRMHPEAVAVLDFAQENDLRLYGHVLLWHSQTPEWFFQDDDGEPLTDSDADKQVLRDRLRTHVFNVAETISDQYGAFGSETNPLVAWDVVNEVIADTPEYADGLRRSEWYRILGEEFIDLAFTYANEAFNGEYAAEGVEHPVTLFINDYNTEQSGKQDRYYALVERLLARGVPVDGVGHQFHVSLSTPVPALGAALDRFAGLPVVQAVTELDVTVGTPVTQANLVEQGYYYRDAFDVFRQFQAATGDMFSVTVWGLHDGRSWRSEQAPLLFDSGLQGKPAYYGAAGAELEPRVLAELSFGGSVPLDASATTAPDWQRLPLHEVGDVAAFQTRWEADHLTVLVRVDDATVDGTDGLSVVVGENTYAFGRDGSGDVPGVVTPTTDGWAAVVHVPLTDAALGDVLDVDIRVTDGETTTGWNAPGVLGTLTLVEPLSFVEVAQAPAAPTIDGEVDDVWAQANVVTTETQIEGSAESAATADIRTLWSGDGSTLYVLADVTDDQVDVSGDSPWIQDSVEIFLDAGNYRNGPYRYDDTQTRINAENAVSFGTGDETFQRNRLASATTLTDTGYRVEASISLLESGGAGTFHGLDFQVNDGTDGARTSVRTWADPTGISYQSTARWGVGQLVEAPFVPDPDVAVHAFVAKAGSQITVDVSGYLPGSTVALRLDPEVVAGRARPVNLGTVTVDDTGAGTARVAIPRQTKLGLYSVVGTSGDLTAEDWLLVVPKLVLPGGPGHGPGSGHGPGHGPGHGWVIWR